MKKTVKVLAPFLLAICILFSFAACGGDKDNMITGDGGIAPDNYYKIEKAGSSFYFPEYVEKGGSSNGIDGYTFSNGNANIVTTDIAVKASKITKSALETSLNASILAGGYNWDFTIDKFQRYKLSGLVILADEITITDNGSGKTFKEYQFTYDTATKQVCITVTFNTLQDAAESDFPEKLLYSISLDA